MKKRTYVDTVNQARSRYMWRTCKLRSQATHSKRGRRRRRWRKRTDTATNKTNTRQYINFCSSKPIINWCENSIQTGPNETSESNSIWCHSTHSLSLYFIFTFVYAFHSSLLNLLNFVFSHTKCKPFGCIALIKLCVVAVAVVVVFFGI